MSNRSRICLALVITVVAACAGAASASAVTYCVNDSVCVAGGGTSEPDLQTVLDLSTSGTNAVHLGAGVYVGSKVDTPSSALGFWFQGTGAGSLSIVGAGRGITALLAPGGTHTGASTLRIDAPSTLAVSISDLTIRRSPATGTSVALGMYTTGSVSRVDISDLDGATSAAGSGVDVQAAPVTITDCSVSVGVAARAVYAHTAASNVTVDRCTLTGGVAAYAAASTTLSVLRSTLMPVGIGADSGAAISDRGAATVRDDLIRLTAQSQNGIYVASGASSSSSAAISNTTISGEGFGDTGGVYADGTAGSGSAQTVAVTFDSSIARTPGIDLVRSPTSGGGVTFTVTEASFITLSGMIAKGPSDFDRTADPQFVDPAQGDFHLRATSPLIDIGSTGAFAGEPATDLAGTVRVVHGRRDVGAYEYAFSAPAADARSSAFLAAIGVPFTFDASASTDADPGDALTFAWSFDDGTSATGAVATHAFATPGAHTATVTVTDPRGLTGSATAYVLVAFPDLTFAPPPGPPFRGVVFSQTKVTLSSAGKVGVKLRCPSTTAGGCRGTLSMSATVSKAAKKAPKKAHAKAKAKPVKIASATFTIKPGVSKTVSLKLSAPARAAVRAKHKLTGLATAVAHDGAGTSATTRRSLTVTPAPTPKKHAR